MENSNADEQDDKHRPLTDRERSIADLACGGLSNREIARRVGVSEGVVKLHLHKVYQKVGVQNRLKLILQWRSKMK
jgi:ATP/maltotriose-dependent transcriptional regulator MalT